MPLINATHRLSLTATKRAVHVCETERLTEREKRVAADARQTEGLRVCVCDCVSETHTSNTATRTRIHSPENADSNPDWMLISE